MRRIIDGGILISIVTTLLYVVSLVNYNGYLSAIGIEGEFVQRSVYQILYDALFVILFPLIQIMTFVIAVGVCLFFCISFYTDIARKFGAIKRLLAKKRLQRRKNIRNRSRAEKSALAIIRIVFFKFFILMAFSLFLMASEKAGIEKGQKLLQKIQDCDYASHNVITHKDYASKIYVVACGINNCSGLEVDTLKVVYFENKHVAGTVSNVSKVANEVSEVSEVSEACRK